MTLENNLNLVPTSYERELQVSAKNETKYVQFVGHCIYNIVPYKLTISLQPSVQETH